MGVHRCGISLHMFNLIAQVIIVNEWDAELNMSREIPYLQTTMYYFVYHINTIAITGKEIQLH